MKNIRHLIFDSIWAKTALDVNHQMTLKCRNEWMWDAKIKLSNRLEKPIFLTIVNTIYQSNKE